MSYQLGTASRPRFARVRPPFGRPLVRPPQSARKVRRRRGPNLPGMFQESSNYRVGRMALSGGTRYLLGGDESQLGFSLKPGRRLRKAARFVKKNVTLKRALIAGAVTGAFFIPGVGPAALAAARAAGRGVVGTVRGSGKFIGHEIAAAERGIVGLFKGKPKGSGPGGDSGSDTGDSGNTPSSPSPPASTGGGGGGSPSGGGGGAPMGPPYTPPTPPEPESGGESPGDFSTAPVPNDNTELTASTAPTDDNEAPSGASGLPILLGLATVALSSVASRGRRRRRAA